jgi:hypothetical protein
MKLPRCIDPSTLLLPVIVFLTSPFLISVSNFHDAGLRYEDILNSSKPSVAEALELADSEVVHGRFRRLKRASDLCLKQKRYIDYAPARPIDEVFQFELLQDINKIEARNAEFEMLNLHKK